VLLLALVAVVAIVWVLIAQPWQTAAVTPTSSHTSAPPSTGATDPVSPSATGTTPASTSTASTPKPTTPKPTTSSTPTGTAAGPCAPTDLVVAAVVDRSQYPSGQNPKLSIKLTNQSTQACTLNVGTSAQTFTITSGSDTWWRSTDCQKEPSDMIVTLKAGQTVSSAQPVVWDRTRSSVSSCDSKTRQRAPGGGATYHLTVSIGGVPSQGDAMFQLY